MANVTSSLSAIGAELGHLPTVLLNIVAALLILLLGFVLAKLVGNLLRKFFHSISLDILLSKALKTRVKIAPIIAGLVSLIIYVASVIWALYQVGILTYVVQYLSMVIVVLILLSLLLSLKDALPNFFLGFILRRKLGLRLKKTISFDNITGIVKEVGLTAIIIETKSEKLFVPYVLLQKKQVTLKK